MTNNPIPPGTGKPASIAAEHLSEGERDQVELELETGLKQKPAKEYQQKAKEARERAAKAKDFDAKQAWEEVAIEFEDLARFAERLGTSD